MREGHGVCRKGTRAAEGGSPWMREWDSPPSEVGAEVGARGNAMGQGGKKRCYPAQISLHAKVKRNEVVKCRLASLWGE